MAYFQEHLGELRLRWPGQHDPALRTAQLGALHALASHFATSTDPAQAVLPTGVGKSAVIAALPFFVPTTRLLVVVPTRLLRDQLTVEFAELATLRRLEVAPAELPAPRVKRVDHRVSSTEAWQAVGEFDVVVGTPGVLSARSPGVVPRPADLFDLIVFDEAHHLPAMTWAGILDQHPARAALFTATPFRRDRKLLPGRLLYDYPLRQAIADGVYAPVDFVPVDSEGPSFDDAIAREAIRRQRAAPHRHEGSLLLVRTDRVAHAKELVELYAGQGVSIGLITAEHSARHVRGVVAALRTGDLDGVASVGALVEGFDLPALKIAAYHRPHRTLPATLQFVGRVARVTGGTAPAELVAVPGQIASETAELYREDVAWSELLPQLFDAAVDHERAVRAFLSELDTQGAEALSPSALRPQRMVQAFRTSGFDVKLDTTVARLARAPVVFHAIDEARTMMVAITERRVRPRWIDSDALDGLEYELYLAVHDAGNGLLFVVAPSDTAARALCEQLGAPKAPLVSPQLINRWLWQQDLVAYSSVGMRTARAPGARQASYRMLAGSAVEGALLPSESRSYAVGHLIARRRDGDSVTGIGVSIRRSRLWETAAAESLLDFRDWCQDIGAALAHDGSAHTTAPHLPLPLPGVLERFPEHPIAMVLDHHLLQGETSIRVEGRGWIDISLFETPIVHRDEHHVLTTWGFDDTEHARIFLHADSSVTAEGVAPPVLHRGEHMTLDELLSDYPPYVYFADGSSTQAATLLVPSAQLAILPAELVHAWDFADTDIRRESEPPREGWSMNVQQRTVAWARANLEEPTIIVDDAAYEIADVVAIEGETSPRVHFFHCKWSSEDTPGARLGDLYEVLGQGVRSARWRDNRACWEELARRVSERRATRVEGADPGVVEERLKSWGAQPPGLELHVWAVQPGVSATVIGRAVEAQTLLLAAMEWTVSQGAVFHLAVNAATPPARRQPAG